MSQTGAASDRADGPLEWACPQSRRKLEAKDGRLRVPGEQWGYEVVEGFPVFAMDEAARRRAEQRSPLLDELLQRLRAGSVEDASDWFCKRHDCTREPYANDWKYLFAPPPEGKILELGAGFGDDSVSLAANASRAVLAVPTLSNARLLQHRLETQRPGPWSIAVLPSAQQLPLADGSVGAIALEQAALAGFAISEQNFARIAAEWKRVLRADGVVFLGLGNALHRLHGVVRLRSKLGRQSSDSLNRTIKRVQVSAGAGALSVTTALNEMRRQGFAEPTVYAPLPSEKESDAIVPVQDRVATGYFLDHLVRKNSPATRSAIAAAHLALKLGWFARLVPYYYLFFRFPGRGSSNGTRSS